MAGSELLDRGTGSMGVAEADAAKGMTDLLLDGGSRGVSVDDANDSKGAEYG